MTWYHGTPDINAVRRTGFEPRSTARRVVINLADLTAARAHALEDGISPAEAHRRLSSLDEHFDVLSLPVPVFLSADRATALSYANDKRAFDYQAADPGVLEVEVLAGPDLVIDAGGETFRGLSWPRVEKALIYQDHDPQEIRDILVERMEVDLSGRIRVSELGAALNLAGMSVVDVENVVDTHDGKGHASTVRMVFDMDLIRLYTPDDLPEP